MAEEAANERRVLVAVDEGDESMCALSWCLKNLVFQNSKDTLILLYVKPPRGGYTPFESTGALDEPESHPGMFTSSFTLNFVVCSFLLLLLLLLFFLISLFMLWILALVNSFLFCWCCVCVSGNLFSPEITAAMERYSQEVAECVLEKAKRLCRDLQHVCLLHLSYLFGLVWFDDKVYVHLSWRMCPSRITIIIIHIFLCL